MALGLSTLISFSAFAQDYYCKDAYEAKLQRIDDNRLLRDIGKNTLLIGVIAGGIVVPVTVLGVGVAGAAIITPLMTAPAGQGLADLIDREHGLKLAKSFIELSQVKREDLRDQYYQEFLDKKVKEVERNTGVATTIDQVQASYPKEEFKLYTVVDHVLENVNKKRSRKDLAEFSYEEFQTELKHHLGTDLFCKKRPETLRKINRLLKRNLI